MTSSADVAGKEGIGEAFRTPLTSQLALIGTFGRLRGPPDPAGAGERRGRLRDVAQFMSCGLHRRMPCPGRMAARGYGAPMGRHCGTGTGARLDECRTLVRQRGSWHPWGMQSVYEAAGGSAGLVRLAEAWHRRVMGD